MHSYQRFEKGVKKTQLKAVGTVGRRNTGTRVHFLPDESYFDSAKISVARLQHLLRAKAVLCPGLKVSLSVEAKKGKTETETWCFEDGLTTYLADALAGAEVFPKTPFVHSAKGNREAVDWAIQWLQERGELTYLERSQASTAIAPGRQIGMQGGGEALDGRLTYGGGLFNGNGRTVENDGDNYMFTGRVQFNSIGTIAFYDDLVVQVGASLGYSSDTAAELGLGSVTGDPAAVPELTTAFAGKRFFWGADFQATYRSWALTGEYLRADYELDAAIGGGGPIDTEAFGGYVELGYRAYGALEAVVRYDGFSPTLGDNRDFMVFGLNVYPGYYAKFGLQYAVGINDSPDAATLADGQFLFVVQVDF